MLNLIVALALAQQTPGIPLINPPDPNRPAGVFVPLLTAGLNRPRITLNASNEPLNPAKLSPKTFNGQHWEFHWHVDGFARVQPTDDQLSIRFRVFSQSHDEEALKNTTELSIRTTRELLRLWEFNANRLKIDHAMDVHRRMVDVYLCDQGAPGGEQLFDQDSENGQQVKVNTIYIYSLKTLDDRLEEAREIAHEYGHAVLPAIGGFNAPEYWANGYLGEKLFLRWLRDGIASGNLSPADAMGASLEDLNRFVESTTTPLEQEAMFRDPSSPTYLGHAAVSMGAFEGLVLWCDSVLPPKALARSFQLLNGNRPLDFLNAAVLAAEETTFEPKLPKGLSKPVWIPVGDGKVTGATILKKDSGWVLIKPTGTVRVTSPLDTAS